MIEEEWMRWLIADLEPPPLHHPLLYHSSPSCCATTADNRKRPLIFSPVVLVRGRDYSWGSRRSGFTFNSQQGEPALAAVHRANKNSCVSCDVCQWIHRRRCSSHRTSPPLENRWGNVRISLVNMLLTPALKIHKITHTHTHILLFVFNGHVTRT